MLKKLMCLFAMGLVCGLSGPALAGIIVAEELLVDLRAEDLEYGAGTTVWQNHGTLDDFTAVGTPVVEDVAGRKAVTFDEPSHFEGPLSVAGIEGDGTRSIEIWVYNGPDFVGEETMVSWSHRGGPDGTNIGFNYGNHGTWGAVGQWGAAADMPWSDPHSPAPAANNWWYLVYTYDGSTVRLYVNAEENTTRDVTLNTHGPNIIRVAAQSNDAGTGAQSGLGFTGSIAEVRIHDGVLSPEAIASNFVSKPGDPIAAGPVPEDEQIDVPRDIVLEWIAGEFAATHDVYFGTSFDDVNNATRTNPSDVLLSQGQTATAYDPDGLLEFSQTYYWRVDEVNAAPDSTIFTGDVWSFTVEPLAYPIEGIAATSNGTSEPDSGPDKTIDGSGLNADGQHSTLPPDMWAGTTGGAEPVWIQYEFDRVYKLYEMKVWNYNVAFEMLLGFGFKDVTIEYSENGVDWTVLKDVQLAQATARATYTANNLVDLEGVAAKYVRLTANSAYGATGQFGLSEVRFLYTPVQARRPEPADGATDVAVDTLLDWRAGREAAAHAVSLGTDAEALPLVDTVTGSDYDPGVLDLDTMYYWRIDEVNEAEAVGTWAGPTWSFTTQESLLVDDFESYNDTDNVIYESWVDGWVNDTGSTVGYLTEPFAERTIIRGGRQAMPLFYDNSGGISVSEAELTLDGGQNWAQAGITTLTLYFYGDLENGPAQVYAKINGTKITGGGSTAVSVWKQWNIDLAATGASLQNVTSLTIGVEGSGSGVIYVDDIRLYRSAPPVVMPSDPGTASLLLHYAFENNATDDSGNGYDGIPMNDPFYDDGVANLGRAMSFDGINDYVEVPIAGVISTATDMSLAAWVNVADSSASWQRIFDFGSTNTGGYMFLAPRTGTSGPIRFAITPAGGGDESIVETPTNLPAGWHHLAVVIDSASMTASVYVDGTVAASGAVETLPQDLGTPTQNWLGRSQYTADSYYDGLIADFSIYTSALSAGEVLYLAGGR